MTRGELTAAIAAVLVAAVALGWILRWIFTHMNGTAPAAELATRLHAAEDALRQAERLLATREIELATALDTLSKTTAETEDIRAAYRAAMAGHAPRN